MKEPTPWISVVITKKNGTLQICLDPKDLNHGIQWEHYPLPTIKEIATQLHEAKLFTSLVSGTLPWMSLLSYDLPHTIWEIQVEEDAI